MKMTEDRFNFFVPATLSKGKDANGNDEMWVQGIASTPDKDLEGETLNPSGYDTSYFLKSGWLKWEHGKNPNQYIGEPTEASITSQNEFFIKGKLYPESKTAQEVYELAEVLEKSNSNRKLGWSIEGKAIERDSKDNKKVKKAMITNVVLTTNPIGKNTFAEIVKGSYEESYIEPEYNREVTCDGEICLLDVKHEGTHYLLTPEFDIVKKAIDCPDLEKAMEAGQITGSETINKVDASGASLKKEDEEGSVKKQSFSAYEDCEDEDMIKKGCHKNNVAKALIILSLAYNAGLLEKSIIEEAKKKVIIN